MLEKYSLSCRAPWIPASGWAVNLGGVLKWKVRAGVQTSSISYTHSLWTRCVADTSTVQGPNIWSFSTLGMQWENQIPAPALVPATSCSPNTVCAAWSFTLSAWHGEFTDRFLMVFSPLWDKLYLVITYFIIHFSFDLVIYKPKLLCLYF